MPAHRRLLAMLSLLVICRNALSYYEANSSPNEGEFEEVGGEAAVAAVAANGDVEKMAAASPNEEVGDAVYQRDTADLWYSKNDPQLLVQPLMNRKRANPKYRRNLNKRMNGISNSINDDTLLPGKPSLSIVSPLEALQRKVAVVYNTRQKEKNRGLLNNYGKRSLRNLVGQRNDVSLDLENDKLNSISCCPHLQRRKFYGVYRVP